MLKYGFGVFIRHDSNKGDLSYVFGASNPGYSMLNYLHINTSIHAVDDILLNLSRVLKGEQKDFLWGADWCIITSQQEQSTIQYYDAADDPNWFEKPLFIEIPTAWFVPAMRDWGRFLKLNPNARYARKPSWNPLIERSVRQNMIYYGFGIEPVQGVGKSDIIYHLRVNHYDYDMDLFKDLVQYNQLPKIDEILQNLSQVIENKQEVYVWGQKTLKFTSHAEQTAIDYPFPETDKPACKTIPTKWLLTMMWDWRLFLELNPKTAYLEKPKSKRAAKKK